ncbi:zinc-binding alcohol dehydrogenase family protein [Modestobacter sp. VKM Ac-2979]|uniref:quinone oxidoreductase family protein n=1 Tax=unclassified Modestobacter TaxID=2643866 RepID=UPI0022ABB21B|nr:MULTISPECIES: zinc-binding alcohol dehydrogenase family protein [unclassified Modestobacter]MCZ2811660.1 zinc-binding alcohol dehydrogenase family protein [Modestobacter sp. VKM Ac-2979]MCZ2843383.1 zinc-binding alcohol dehydrogenase family protein [Modestobacter sp. VKM Ac-2980]
MRAAILTSPGEPPALADHPDPVPGEGRTLVRVTAAPVVPLDLLCASGTSYFGRPAVPYVPGVQGVGVVVSSAVLAPGTRVWFATSAGMSPGDGSLGELCAVPDADVVPLAGDLPDPVVAALGLSAVAGWMALTWRGRLQPGERVLVLGAGGAVGQAALGAARALGAGRVVGVCRSPSAADRARRAGAEDVVLTGDGGDLAARIRQTVGSDVDLVVDPVFGAVAAAACSVLAPGGRLVNLGGAAGDAAEFSSAVLRSRSIDVLGYTNNALTGEQRAAALTAVLRHAAAGQLRVEHAVLPLARVEEAWAATAAGGGSRSVVELSAR